MRAPHVARGSVFQYWETARLDPFQVHELASCQDFMYHHAGTSVMGEVPTGRYSSISLMQLQEATCSSESKCLGRKKPWPLKGFEQSAKKVLNRRAPQIGAEYIAGQEAAGNLVSLIFEPILTPRFEARVRL